MGVQVVRCRGFWQVSDPRLAAPSAPPRGPGSPERLRGLPRGTRRQADFRRSLGHGVGIPETA